MPKIPWNKGIKGRQPWMNTSGLGKNIDFKKRGKSISKSVTGIKRSDSYKEERSRLMKKKWADPEYRVSQIESQKGKVPWNKRKKCPQLSGEHCHLWKGGVTPQRMKDRTTFTLTISKDVLERDNYTCQMCGKKGGQLHVDHIQPWAEYVEGRFSMDNCRTLCIRCHYKVTFGKEMPKGSKWGVYKENIICQ